MTERSAIYLRKSRLDVELEKQGEQETLSRHKKILLELAEKRGLNVTDIYKEVVSGESISARPEMKRLLSDIKKHKFKNVVVMEIERLARGATKDQGEVAEAFKMSNTFVITPAKTYDPNNEFDEEYFEFSLYMSRREYKTLTRRMNTGKIQSVKEGNYLGSRRPYGYEILKRGKNDRTLTPHPKEADVVKLIFEMWVDRRLNAGQIARELTAQGIKTLRGAVEWNRGVINEMLRNKLYIGKIHWYKRKLRQEMDGENIIKKRRVTVDGSIMEIDGKHPPLISMETFEAAQKLFVNVAPVHDTKKIKNPFAGILRCKKCDKVMTLNHFKHSATRIQHRGSYVCRVKSTKYENVLQAVIQTLKEKIADFEIELKDCNTEKEVENYKRMSAQYAEKIKKLEAKKHTLFDLFEEGTYTKEEFVDRKKILSDQLAETYELAENLEAPDEHEIETRIATFYEVAETLKNEKIEGHIKNQLLKDIISVIYYSYGDGPELDIHFK